MTRSEILETAEKMVTGHREQDYGSAENNFALIAAFWNLYLEAINYSAIRPLKASDIAMMMAFFKEARIITGTGTEDSFVDACGYLACGGEIVTSNAFVTE